MTQFLFFQVVRNRIDTQPRYLWNSPPGHLQIHSQFSSYPRDYPQAKLSPLPSCDSLCEKDQSLVNNPKYTAVVTAFRPALRESSPLSKLLQGLSESPHLGGVVVLWAGRGAPQVL